MTPVASKILRNNINTCNSLLFPHHRFSNTEHELLLLSALGGWEIGGQEVFECLGDFVLSNCSDVLKSFLGCLEGLEGSELDHLREAFYVTNRLLDLFQLAADLIEVVFLKQSIP